MKPLIRGIILASTVLVITTACSEGRYEIAVDERGVEHCIKVGERGNTYYPMAECGK